MKKISIIIVHYKVKEELFACLQSVQESSSSHASEVIVVDNDETKTIETALKGKFPSVKYVKSPGNIGFGAGNNLGAKYARGDYLFFLNPDTKVFPGTIDKLIEFMEKNKKAGIAAPLLLNRQGRPYPLQGAGELTPLVGMVVLSFLNKLFPKNPISQKYWLFDWDKRGIKEVAVVPGTALIISKSLFKKVGGFDERFFLYFEESDLCRRVRNLGYKIYMDPTAPVIHLWGRSTKGISEMNKIFNQSRFLYFRKHFGLLSALMVHLATTIGKIHLLLGGIFVMGLFLRLYRLPELMPFIGDQGWFYLSARDLILEGKIPLVGITASITWLHQGALWTYLLAPVLWLGNFNPVSGAYLTAIFGVATVFLVYQAGKLFFNQKVALLAAAFYAVSPWVVFQDRMAYHTSIIPFFTLLFFLTLFKLVQGQGKYLPLVAVSLGLLYQLELATTVLVPVFFLAFWYFRPKIKRGNLALTLILLLFSLAPILLYDFTSGFKQTLGFGAWIFYRLVSFFGGFGGEHLASQEKFSKNFAFLAEYGKRILVWGSSFVAAVLMAGILVTIVYYLLKIFKTKKDLRKNPGLFFCLAWLLIPLLGFFLQQAPSEAYIPLLFPVVILWVALMFNQLLTWKRLFYPILLAFLTLIGYNLFFFTSSNFLQKIYKPTFGERMEAARFIVAKTNGEPYNLQAKGPGSEFENFTKNWQYLTWWLGNEPKDQPQKLQFVIYEPKDVARRSSNEKIYYFENLAVGSK